MVMFKFILGFKIIHYHTQEQIKANKIQKKNNTEPQHLCKFIGVNLLTTGYRI